jgi:hypothetical protein
MSYGTEVPDGATQRHSRIMELLTLINVNEPHGASLVQIQAHMLATYGLKFKTTSEMVQELGKSGILKVDGHGYWHLKQTQREAFKKILEDEKNRHIPAAIAQKINKIKDEGTREKAFKLFNELYQLLLDAEEST